MLTVPSKSNDIINLIFLLVLCMLILVSMQSSSNNAECLEHLGDGDCEVIRTAHKMIVTHDDEGRLIIYDIEKTVDFSIRKDDEGKLIAK